MRKNVQLASLSAALVALAVIAIGFLLFRNPPPVRPAPEPPPAVRRPSAPKPAPAGVVLAEAPAAPRPAAVAAPLPPLGETDIARRVEELLREYDAIVNEPLGSPADVDRVATLRDRQQRLDKLVEKLAALGAPAVPVLDAVLKADGMKPELIGRLTIVVRALARIPGKESVRALGDSLGASDNFTLKMTVVLHLAEHGGAEGGEILARRLASEQDPRVRARILSVLGQHRGAEALPVLERVARDDPTPTVRVAAIRALGDAKDPQAARTLELIARTNDDVSCRQNAIQIYGRIMKEEGLPLLEDLVRNDSNVRIKAVAVIALQEVKGDRARQILESVANDPAQGEDIRARARGALAALDREAQAAASGVEIAPLDAKIDRRKPMGTQALEKVRIGEAESER